MKLYISPSTDEPTEGIQGIVSSARGEVEQMGHLAISPLSHDGVLLPWSSRLEVLTKECAGIYLLEGWQDSIEASVEQMLCLTTGKKVIYQSSRKKKLDEEQAKAAASLRIQQAIHEVTGHTLAEYQARTREEEHVLIRMIFAYHARRAGLSPDDIAGILCNSRSMAYHYFNRYDDEFRYTPKFRKMATEVDILLKQ